MAFLYELLLSINFPFLVLIHSDRRLTLLNRKFDYFICSMYRFNIYL